MVILRATITITFTPDDLTTNYVNYTGTERELNRYLNVAKKHEDYHSFTITNLEGIDTDRAFEKKPTKK